MQENPNLLDMEQVNTLKEIFNSTFNEFIKKFFDDFENKTEKLLEEINQKRSDNIIKLAHALKGSSLNVGAVGLANICIKIELAAKNDNFDEILHELKKLEEVFKISKEMYLH